MRKEFTTNIIKIGVLVLKTGKKEKKTRKILVHKVDLLRDVRERNRYDACKYLPHQGDRERARRRAAHG